MDEAEMLVALELGVVEAGGVDTHAASTHFVQVITPPELSDPVRIAA